MRELTLEEMEQIHAGVSCSKAMGAACAYAAAIGIGLAGFVTGGAAWLVGGAVAGPACGAAVAAVASGACGS